MSRPHPRPFLSSFGEPGLLGLSHAGGHGVGLPSAPTWDDERGVVPVGGPARTMCGRRQREPSRCGGLHWTGETGTSPATERVRAFELHQVHGEETT